MVKPHLDAPAPPAKIFLFGALALIAGVAAAKVWKDHHGPTFDGRLVAHTTNVTADRAGVVSELIIGEGEWVGIGDRLMTLTDEDLQRQITASEEAVLARKVELAQAEALADVELAWRLKELDAEITATQLKAADYLKEKYNHELERSMWTDVLSGYETVMFEAEESQFQSMLLKTRLPSEQRMNAMLRLETADNAVDVSDAQVEICERQLEELRRVREQVPTRIREKAGVNVAEKRLAAAESALAALKERETELCVLSDCIGRVGTYRRQIGDHLEPGDSIVELLDDSRRWVVLEVPSAEIPEFTIGLRLALEFPGDEMREGEVLSIAPQTDSDSASDNSDPHVKVRVRQVGKLWPDVPIGSRIEAHIAE